MIPSQTGATLTYVALYIKTKIVDVSVPYSVMDAYHVIHFHANFGRLVILQSLTFLVSLLYGTWRYR